ncbi:immunity protein Imm33 domain-containing protein [Acinetobacter baumannii]|uniref:immunity protein Imm33 domain-containing protein n=1 Tax=Acinetobacter baumannii TaxID=470 RepID=UPI0038919337
MKDILKVQKECCDHYEEKFFPVELDQLVVVSNGVLEGEIPIEGVRYRSPKHMSGWWLTSDKYDGDIETLKNIHFTHILEKRPDLAIYMALPYGYRFILGGEEEHIWFDENALDE